MPCGSTSSAPSSPATASARTLVRSTRRIHAPKTRAASSFTAAIIGAAGASAGARRALDAPLRRAAACLGDVARQDADLGVAQRAGERRHRADAGPHGSGDTLL